MISPSMIKLTPEIEELNVTPSKTAQTIEVATGIDGYGPVNVSAVDATIDNNIVADNIKSGVTILGVEGTVTELKGETKTVTPTTNQQTITPTSGKNGITEVTVNAVTSSIDNNIQANNIKEGVSILGINGNITPLNGTTITIDPSTVSQTEIPQSPYNGFTSVTVSAVTSSIDSNIQAGNIKKGVTILGITGTHEGGGSGSKSLGYLEVTQEGVLQPVSTSVDFASQGIYEIHGNSLLSNLYGRAQFTEFTGGFVKKVSGNNVCSNMFMESYYLESVDFSNLEEISGANAFSYAFGYCSNLTSVNLSRLKHTYTDDMYGEMTFAFAGCSKLKTLRFNSLESIDNWGNWAQSSSLEYVYFDSLITINTMGHGFNGVSSLKEVQFPKLTSITGNKAFSYTFANTGITELRFPALTSFGRYNTQFDDMLKNCSNVTVHFPVDLQYSVGYWTSTKNGFSGTNTTILFDLGLTNVTFNCPLGTKIYINQQEIADGTVTTVTRQQRDYEYYKIYTAVSATGEIYTGTLTYDKTVENITENIDFTGKEYITVTPTSDIANTDFHLYYMSDLDPNNYNKCALPSYNGTFKVVKNSGSFYVGGRIGNEYMSLGVTTYPTTTNCSPSLHLIPIPSTFTYTCEEFYNQLIAPSDPDNLWSYDSVNDCIKATSNQTPNTSTQRGFTILGLPESRWDHTARIVLNLGVSAQQNADYGYVALGTTLPSPSAADVSNWTYPNGWYYTRKTGEVASAEMQIYHSELDKDRILGIGYVTDSDSTFGETDGITITGNIQVIYEEGGE